MKSQDLSQTNQLKYQIAQEQNQMKLMELQQKDASEVAERQLQAEQHQMDLSKELVIHPVSPSVLQQTYSGQE